MEQRISLEEKQKWVTKMLGHDFEIIYKKGKKNVVADALSRKDEVVKALLDNPTRLGRWRNEQMEKWRKNMDIYSKAAIGS